MTYEIEITRFVPEPVTERFTAATSGDAALRTQLADTVEFVVFVAALDRERKVDCGNFYVWCNSERALIELHEHHEHYATDSQIDPGQNREVLFRGEDGGSFSVSYQRTVSRDQAMTALHFWLPAQKRIPRLVWT